MAVTVHSSLPKECRLPDLRGALKHALLEDEPVLDIELLLLDPQGAFYRFENLCFVSDRLHLGRRVVQACSSCRRRRRN